MKYLVSTSLVVSMALACTEADFARYITEHGKSYATREEFNMRMKIFHDNDNKIRRLNSSNGTSFHAHNKYSDWMNSEYIQLLGYADGKKALDMNRESLPVEGIPESIDWRELGAVTKVKDQGTCGSCYAFSAIGSLEGAWYLAHDELIEFSPQNAVDCSYDYENYGCMGGWQENVYDYSFWYPIMTEADYPYLGKDSFCAWQAPGVVFAQQTHTVPYGDPDQLRAALAKQPIAVTIDAGDSVFQSYSSGVITEGCGKKLSHAVLAVGYGSENGQDYFLVKNSWGSDWGDDGYVKIGIVEGDDVCGILQHSLYPSVN